MAANATVRDKPLSAAAPVPAASETRLRADAGHLLAALDRMKGREHLSLNVTTAMESLRHALVDRDGRDDNWRGPH